MSRRWEEMLEAVCRLAAASASGPGGCGPRPWCRHRFIREEVAAQCAARRATSDHPSVAVMGRGGRVVTECPRPGCRSPM